MSGSPASQNAALFTQIVGLINQQQWAAAERMLTQVLSLRPADADGLQLMGLVRANTGRKAEAEALYRRSLAVNPKQPHVQTNLGTLLAQSGRAEAGSALLRAAWRSQPGYADALLSL